MTPNDAPILSQSVRWGENYVSRALNIKSAGIIPPGIYHGYHVKPGGDMAVLIDHDGDYPRSVAVVERDGYSLTIIMDDPGLVQIPSRGTWYICIEAFYAPTHQGYQRIVAREEVEPHHVVLGKVVTDIEGEDSTASVIITPEMIFTDSRMQITLDTGINRETMISLATQAIRMSNRITRLELNNAVNNISGLLQASSLDYRGILLGEGVCVAPVTIVPEGVDELQGAALTMIVDKINKS